MKAKVGDKIPILQTKKENIDVELFGKYYPELKKYAFTLTARLNRTDIHQDLLHDCIHAYLSHEDKDKIEDAIAWLKVKLYKEVYMERSNFNLTYIVPNRKEAYEICDDIVKAKPQMDISVVRQLIAQWLMSDFHFVERTLLHLRLHGYNNKEISEMFELPYDTVCRVVRKSVETLAEKAKGL